MGDKQITPMVTFIESYGNLPFRALGVQEKIYQILYL